MRDDSVVMRASDAATVGDILTGLGIAVEAHRTKIGESTLKCSRGDASVILAVTRPDTWAQLTDERRDLAIVALMSPSLMPWKKRPTMRCAMRSSPRSSPWLGMAHPRWTPSPPRSLPSPPRWTSTASTA